MPLKRAAGKSLHNTSMIQVGHVDGLEEGDRPLSVESTYLQGPPHFRVPLQGNSSRLVL